MAKFDSIRMHAIILTQNRAEVLKRSVSTALRKLGRCDVLTVLDDSAAKAAAENADLLTAVARQSPAMVAHLLPARLYETIAGVTGGSALEWQSRTAQRDIAPLRNLALLLSAAVRARTTILIDDDICGFDLELTHERLEQLAAGSQDLIMGAEIGGQSEMDTITQLHESIRRPEARQISRTIPLDELSHKIDTGHDTRDIKCGWVSAGYMAFNLNPTRLFAFPPGYNEDWLWCLLHSISGKVRVVRGGQVVQHAPPEPRRATPSDILFELAGDLVFDCLCVHREGGKRTPLATLATLARHTPSPEVLPTTRIAEVVELARQSTSNGRVRTCLKDPGLNAVKTVMRSRDLRIRESAILPDWCNDAIAKHKSYSPLPTNEVIQRAMATMTLEGGSSGDNAAVSKLRRHILGGHVHERHCRKQRYCDPHTWDYVIARRIRSVLRALEPPGGKRDTVVQIRLSMPWCE